jgi:hypothetical protein
MTSTFSDAPRKDKFWGDDPKILFQYNRLIEFFPTNDMSESEKLNAISRFCIYSGIVLYIYHGGETWPLYIPVLGLAATLFMSKSIKVEYLPVQEEEYEKLDNDHKYNEFNPLSKDENYANPPPLNYQQRLKNTIEDKWVKEHGGKPKIIMMDNEACIAPTRNNPFMNVTIDQYTDFPLRPKACPYDRMEAEVSKEFNYDLYKDVGDVFSKNNSQRQYYTTPITQTSNEQGDFARWLYGTPVGSTCKEDTRNCIGVAQGDNHRYLKGQSRDSGYLPGKIIKNQFP